MKITTLTSTGSSIKFQKGIFLFVAAILKENENKHDLLMFIVD